MNKISNLDPSEVEFRQPIFKAVAHHFTEATFKSERKTSTVGL